MHTIEHFINRIHYGDCIEVMRRMPDASVDLCLTDPPYLVSYRSRDGRTIAGDRDGSWLRPAYEEIARVLKPGRFCITFYGWHCADAFMEAWRAAGLSPVGHLVFVKNYVSNRRARFAAPHHENAYILAKGNPQSPRFRLPDVLSWRYTGNRLHPTQKPVPVFKRLIASFSDAGDIVLDPFAGSGTTALAARILHRSYIGIEKEWQYYCIARDRLKVSGRGRGT
jgi:adenine-specific DNA-methyltransferase